MDERTLTIIIIGINIIMWFLTISQFTSMARRNDELEKKQNELIKKQTDYLHMVHESINQMTGMNIEAMGTFIKQISEIMEQQGAQSDAPKNRK